MPIPLTVGVNAQRFRSTIERSAEVGRGREGGLPRLASSDAGLEVKVDRVGNIFARRSGQDDSLPPVLLGSHLDTQANGGRFDGIVGVMGAFEVARTLDDLQHVTRRPLEIINGAVGAVASRAGCTADILDHWAWGGRIFNDELISLVRGHAAALGCRHRDLTSQAGHDAYFLARICPTAMMFTPCRDGIAHHNVESAGLEDLEPSLNVLLHRAVSRADRR